MEESRDKHDEQTTLWMSMALDGLLDAQARQQLDQHLAVCSTCRAEWQAMQEVSALFERSAMVGPPLGFAVHVERKLAEKSQKRRRLFRGVAVFTSSLSLAGLTLTMVLCLALGVIGWRWIAALPTVQQGTSAIVQVVSSMGVLGKGASFLLSDLLLRYAPPLVIGLGIGLAILGALWVWLFLKRPGSSRRNGYI